MNNKMKFKGLEDDIKIIAELQYNWDKLSNKTLLVSGGTGFIGAFLCDVIRYRNEKYSQNIRVISLSRRGGQDDETVTYLQRDITVPFLANDKVDYVIHLASNTHPKQYAEDPIGTITTNIYGCDNLLRIASENHARFLLASSVEIYGQGTPDPMDETYSGYIDCNQARSGYNEAKRVCESLCQSYRLKHGVDVVIARLSRVFGPDKKEDTKAMSQFMNKALNNEDVVLKSKGEQRYSYCYIADAVSGLLKILLDGENGEAYNVSDEDEGMTLYDYAVWIAGFAEKRVILSLEDNSSVSKAVYALLDTKKLKDLGWSSMYSVRDALKRTYQIMKERQ